MPEFNAYTIFVDECGCESLKKLTEENRYFILSFCIFDKTYYSTKAVPALQRLKFENFGHDQTILHGYEMMQCIGEFECLADNNFKNDFLNQLNNVIEDTNFIIISSVIDKLKLVDIYKFPENPYELALKFCIERLYYFFEERRQIDKKTHIIIESRDATSNQRLEEAFKRITDGYNYQKKKLPFELKFISKRSNSAGLQFADLIHGPLLNRYQRPHKSHRNFETLEKKFYCKGGRKFTGSNFDGYGLKVFPK